MICDSRILLFGAIQSKFRGGMVGWFETEPPYVALADLELSVEKLASVHRNLPISASQVLEFHGSFSNRKEYYPTSS